MGWLKASNFDPLSHIVSGERRLPLMARSAERLQVRRFQPQMWMRTHWLDVINIGRDRSNTSTRTRSTPRLSIKHRRAHGAPPPVVAATRCGQTTARERPTRKRRVLCTRLHVDTGADATDACHHRPPPMPSNVIPPQRSHSARRLYGVAMPPREGGTRYPTLTARPPHRWHIPRSRRRIISRSCCCLRWFMVDGTTGRASWPAGPGACNRDIPAYHGTPRSLRTDTAAHREPGPMSFFRSNVPCRDPAVKAPRQRTKWRQLWRQTDC